MGLMADLPESRVVLEKARQNVPAARVNLLENQLFCSKLPRRAKRTQAALLLDSANVGDWHCSILSGLEHISRHNAFAAGPGLPQNHGLHLQSFCFLPFALRCCQGLVCDLTLPSGCWLPWASPSCLSLMMPSLHCWRQLLLLRVSALQQQASGEQSVHSVLQKLLHVDILLSRSLLLHSVGCCEFGTWLLPCGCCAPSAGQSCAELLTSEPDHEEEPLLPNQVCSMCGF